MDIKSIIDLPNEVIEKFLMVYLPSNDVSSLGMIGIKRFKELSEVVLEKRGKLTSSFINGIIIFGLL